jgi:hypothetical protein
VARLDQVGEVEPGAVEPAEVVAVHGVAGRLGDPAAAGAGLERRPALPADDEDVLRVDVLGPGQPLFQPAVAAGEEVVALVGVQERRGDRSRRCPIPQPGAST